MFKPETYQLKLLSSVDKQIGAYAKDKNAERLHQIRVLIKKIKAVDSLRSFASKKKQGGVKLKPLYKSAGKIREIQILLKLVQALPGFPKKIKEQLKINLKAEQKYFLEKLPKFSKQIKKVHNELSVNGTRLGLKIIKKYFTLETQKAQLAFKLKQREAMHAFRKELKNSLYVYDALPKKTQKLIPLKTNEIVNLQEKLGDWHDAYSAIFYLSKLKPQVNIQGHLLKLKRQEKAQFISLQKMQMPKL